MPEIKIIDFLKQKNQKTKISAPKNRFSKFIDRVKSWPWTFIGVLTFFVCVILGCTYWISPLSHVNEIQVSGSQTVGDQQIIDASDLTTRTSIFTVLFDSSNSKALIKKHIPQVKSVNYSVHNWNNVTLHVQEYRTVGFEERNNKYYAILQNGKIINHSVSHPVDNAPVYQSFKSDRYLQRMIKVDQMFPTKIQNSISEIEWIGSRTNPYRIRLFMNDGNEIIADMRTVVKKIKYYPAMRAKMKEKGVIDLEVGAYSYPFSKK